MTDQQVSRVQFMDGVAIEEDGVRIFIAGDLQSGNYNLSRLFYFEGGNNWIYFDVATVVVAVCLVAKPKRTCLAVGRDGLVWVAVRGSAPFLEHIADAGTGKGKYGYLSQIREIGGEVYACGDEGQVYKRGSNGWLHFDKGVLETRERKQPNCHNGIDGTGPDDIYVVGEYGRIFHFDGKKWTRVGAQTNSHLERVRCVNPDEVYVCGADGVLLRGNRQGWIEIGDPDMTDHIWDLEYFGKKLYLAVEDTLMVHDGKTLEPVDTKLDPPIDAHRLSSRKGILWSFGEDHLAYFDGSQWTRVVHPDNV